MYFTYAIGAIKQRSSDI